MSEGQGLICKDPLNQTGANQGSKLCNLYPEVDLQDMTVNSFTKWTVKQLKAFLEEKQGKRTGNKDVLARNAFEVWLKEFNISKPRPISQNRSKLDGENKENDEPRGQEQQQNAEKNTKGKLKDNMTKEDFSIWTIPQLQDFLSAREINQTGNKATLVHNVFMAYHMKVPVS